jgi:DNA invertase Pin-like site-specific DNA recombinase
MLKERSKAGLDAARQGGRIGGHWPKLSALQQAEIKKMVSKGDKTATDAARLFKIHPATEGPVPLRPVTDFIGHKQANLWSRPHGGETV